jgi:hypothetical protein
MSDWWCSIRLTGRKLRINVVALWRAYEEVERVVYRTLRYLGTIFKREEFLGKTENGLFLRQPKEKVKQSKSL